MDFVLLDTQSQEWTYIWQWLSEHPLNIGLDEPETAENQGYSWEYIGSYKLGDKILHEFRHMCHPSINGAVKTSVVGSESFTIEQIQKSFRIKP
jgi:hypothetical protein